MATGRRGSPYFGIVEEPSYGGLRVFSTEAVPRGRVVIWYDEDPDEPGRFSRRLPEPRRRPSYPTRQVRRAALGLLRALRRAVPRRWPG